MSTGAWVVVAAVALALAFGAYRLLTDGRFRRTATVVEVRRAQRGASKPPHATDLWSQVSTAVPDARLGERATLLQFSSAFCAPCRATRRTLADVAAVVPGVTHLEVDAEHHLDLVRRLDVRRTPTTLVLDDRGREVTRASGAPRKEHVLQALGSVS